MVSGVKNPFPLLARSFLLDFLPGAAGYLGYNPSLFRLLPSFSAAT